MWKMSTNLIDIPEYFSLEGTYETVPFSSLILLCSNTLSFIITKTSLVSNVFNFKFHRVHHFRSFPRFHFP